jgi:poly-gamma-glutamate capsule biosynthesis protein CapA/YwtB (metallophosphatase superfamily)
LIKKFLFSEIFFFEPPPLNPRGTLMKQSTRSLRAVAALLGLASMPALAAGLAASSAAGGSSASSASINSVENSSTSSTRAVANINGPYRIVDVTPTPQRQGMVRMTLAAVDKAGDPLVLDLPQQTFERTGLAAGSTINASQRPYGVEFADAGNAKAFFLLLNNDWHQDLRSTPVSL